MDTSVRTVGTRSRVGMVSVPGVVMDAWPSGTVTFLFTHIEGSTSLWERDRAVMAAAVARHFALLRQAITAHRGTLFKVVGDAAQAAFPTVPDAVAAALAAQWALEAEPWPAAVAPLRVRMALHTTAAEPHEDDYLAPGLNRLARLCRRPWRTGTRVARGAGPRPRGSTARRRVARPRGARPARPGAS